MPGAVVNIEEAVQQELTGMLLKLDPLLGGVPLTVSKVADSHTCRGRRWIGRLVN